MDLRFENTSRLSVLENREKVSEEKAGKDVILPLFFPALHVHIWVAGGVFYEVLCFRLVESFDPEAVKKHTVFDQCVKTW